MGYEHQEPRSNVMRGRIIQFLRRNLFQVQLEDGRHITAAMPEEWLPYGLDCLQQPPGCWVAVTVRLRKAPRLAVIVHAEHSGLTC